MGSNASHYGPRIPFTDIRQPNFYEGYYDFNNGMSRFEDMKCYIDYCKNENKEGILFNL